VKLPFRFSLFLRIFCFRSHFFRFYFAHPNVVHYLLLTITHILTFSSSSYIFFLDPTVFDNEAGLVVLNEAGFKGAIKPQKILGSLVSLFLVRSEPTTLLTISSIFKVCSVRYCSTLVVF